MILSDNGNTSFEQPPTGSHAARCIAIIDLGTQRSTYEGEAQIKRQVIVRWELPTELMTTGDFAGKPFTVSKFYTASLHEKSGLRKDLASWRGRDFTAEELKGFDLKSVLGKACMLAVGLSEKGKAKVTSVMGLPKGMNVPSQVNPSVHFSLDANEFKDEVFEALPKGFKEMIVASPEHIQLMRRRANPGQEPAAYDEGLPVGEDEIPF
jgi:hypothetical protein